MFLETLTRLYWHHRLARASPSSEVYELFKFWFCLPGTICDITKKTLMPLQSREGILRNWCSFTSKRPPDSPYITLKAMKSLHLSLPPSLSLPRSFFFIHPSIVNWNRRMCRRSGSKEASAQLASVVQIDQASLELRAESVRPRSGHLSCLPQ